MFEVRSTSVETKRIARAIRVMQRRVGITRRVDYAGLYVCKVTAGTTLYSAHSFGDAVDLMVDSGIDDLAKVADLVVKDATEKTTANLGKPTEVVFVIAGHRQWVKGKGWSVYSGTDHLNHVHVGCSFSVSSPKPSCAGGSPYLPGVAYVKG